MSKQLLFHKNSACLLQPKEAADIIITIRVITGSDHTSGSYGHGMRKVMSGAEERELMCESLELVDLPGVGNIRL